MKRLLLIYHSQSGTTEALAQSVVKGIRSEPEIDLSVKQAMEANSDDLLNADAVIFGTPENLGYMSGGLKDFFDRTYYPCQESQINIPYAIFVSAGNDGSGAVREIERIALGYPLKKVTDAIIVKGEPNSESFQRCEELGQTLAAGLSLGVF